MTGKLLQPIAGPVRELLSGRRDGRSATAMAIAKPPGAPGWFTPENPIWTVHGSVATFVGGIRALLLQTLQPLALAGVSDHSSYRTDPFGRLQRTGAFIAATTFGSVTLAEQTVAAVTRRHQSVVGTAPDGRPYAADDPRLLLWVHCTLTDSFLASYLRFGREGAIDSDQYVADMARIAVAMKVPEPPCTVAELNEALASFDHELDNGPRALQVQKFVRHPPLSAALRPGYAILASGAANTLEGRYATLLGRSDRKAALIATENAACSGLLRALKLALVESPAKAAGERRLGLRPATQGLAVATG